MNSQHAGLRFIGSLTTAWARDCAATARTATVIHSPFPTAVSLTGITGPQVVFEGLTIRASDPATNSESSLAVRVTNSSLALRSVNVFAGRGNQGTNSVTPGGARDLACNGNADCGTGTAGPVGGIGRPSDGGTFNVAGFVTGDGAQGGPGVDGQNGTAPAPPPPNSCVTSCSGATPCNGGNTFCGEIQGSVTSGIGRCGCGGRGGAGATGGRGGGASVALFVSGASSNVSVGDSSLVAGPGGQGGSGSVGGRGGPGTPGAQGAPSTCRPWGSATCGRVNDQCNNNCEIFGPSIPVPGGAPGGDGGVGGIGGSGGAGAGGPSIALVTVGATQVSVMSSVLLPDAGGAASGGARAGLSLPRLDLP